MNTYKTAKVIVTLYLTTALALSFTHIADLFGILGSDWQRWIAPIMIDAVAVIGKMSMSTAFTPATRKRGKIALWVAGSISFTANVTVGVFHNRPGDAILGAIVVFGALWAEAHLTHLRPTTKRRPPAGGGPHPDPREDPRRDRPDETPTRRYRLLFVATLYFARQTPTGIQTSSGTANRPFSSRSEFPTMKQIHAVGAAFVADNPDCTGAVITNVIRLADSE